MRNLEAEIKARRSEVNPTYQHYGSAESLSNDDISLMEAEIKARRSEIKPTYQHYGSVESLSDSDLSIMQAQVAERRRRMFLIKSI